MSAPDLTGPTRSAGQARPLPRPRAVLLLSQSRSRGTVTLGADAGVPPAASAPPRPPASHTSSAAPQRAHSPKASCPPSCHPARHTARSRVEGGRAVPWDGAPIPTPAHPERQADAGRAGGASAWEPVFCTLGR